MPSFVSVMDQIVNVLIADVELNAFASATLGKAFTAANVKKVFKNRQDILIQDFPLLMITRPSVTGAAESSISGDYQHTVRIYFGFILNDRYKAQDALIQLDELIENAIMVDSSLGGLVDFVSPSSFDNDEGYNYPQFFGMKEFIISRGQSWN